MKTPRHTDPTAAWLAVYGASFALQLRDRQRSGLELDDDFVDTAIEEAETVANWQQERTRECP